MSFDFLILNLISLISQFLLLYNHHLCLQWKNKERFISPFVFSVITMVIFNFGTADLGKDINIYFYPSKIIIVVLLVLQIVLSKIFDAEDQDGVFDLILSYNINPTVLYLSKYLQMIFETTIIIIPIFLMSYIFNQAIFYNLNYFFIILVIFSTVLSLSAIGIMVSILVRVANNSHILYPIIYFTLSIPVIISSNEIIKLYLTNADYTLIYKWFFLLGISFIVYLLLGILFFEEILGKNVKKQFIKAA